MGVTQQLAEKVGVELLPTTVARLVREFYDSLTTQQDGKILTVSSLIRNCK